MLNYNFGPSVPLYRPPSGKANLNALAMVRAIVCHILSVASGATFTSHGDTWQTNHGENPAAQQAIQLCIHDEFVFIFMCLTMSLILQAPAGQILA